jgi:DNA-binding NarL/FixJ family response regulator
MKILIVDDHALFVEGLKGLLQINGFEVAGTANDCQDALEKVRALQPEVVLMDINMPPCSGIEGTRLIKAEFPEVQVVILTMSADDNDLFEAIKSGAAGYIVKDIKPKLFLSLLSGVTRGEAAITREMASRIMGEFLRSDRSGAQSMNARTTADEKDAGSKAVISARQADIIKQVAEGLTYKEIAAMLAISERTVNYHMAEIINKLHLQNRAQVIAYATSHGLIRTQKSDRKNLT